MANSCSMRYQCGSIVRHWAEKFDFTAILCCFRWSNQHAADFFQFIVHEIEDFRVNEFREKHSHWMGPVGCFLMRTTHCHRAACKELPHVIDLICFTMIVSRVWVSSLCPIKSMPILQFSNSIVVVASVHRSIESSMFIIIMFIHAKMKRLVGGYQASLRSRTTWTTSYNLKFIAALCFIHRFHSENRRQEDFVTLSC